LPILEEILALKLLLDKNISVRVVRCPIVAGNFPVSLLFSRISLWILESLPIDDGKLPVSLFSDNRQNTRELSLETEEGILPVICL
jgi:hypothetical protein